MTGCEHDHTALDDPLFAIAASMADDGSHLHLVISACPGMPDSTLAAVARIMSEELADLARATVAQGN